MVIRRPVQVKGVNSAFAGKPTTIMVFDQDRTEIGQTSPAAKPSFSTSVPYTSSFQGETQEGVIALYTSTGNHIIAGAVMVKVLLSA